MADEKRKYLRVKKNFDFIYNLRGHSEVLETKTHDISQGGIGFYTALSLKIKDIVHLRMQIPGFSGEMGIRGIVRWIKLVESKKLFVGIEFFNIEEEEKNIILKALREG